jgi:type VI secretion system secreted protein VgrG
MTSSAAPSFSSIATGLATNAAAELAALFGSWTQRDRLLRLATPLDALYGPNTLLPEMLQAVEGMDMDGGQQAGAPLCGYRLSITALSLSAHLELKQLIGQPVLLELLTAHSRTGLRPFHGHVIHCECIGANGGMARYRLTVEPWMAFLQHRRDSRVFQDMSTIDIVEAVFRNYQAQGQLVPAWRIDVADPAVYPKRSLTIQHQETDLAFVERLLLEEGLFYWFEHTGDIASPSLGSHTLVLADHNDAFAPNMQADIAFTQSGTVMKHDSIDRWQASRHWQTNAVEVASWDYRTLSMRPVSVPGTGINSVDPMVLVNRDVPGVYAYQDRAQGERIALRRMQAIEARNKRFTAAGTVRTAAPGTTFMLTGHADHDRDKREDDRTFIMLRVVHLARNNLHAELKAATAARLGEAEPDADGDPMAVSDNSLWTGLNSALNPATSDHSPDAASEAASNATSHTERPLYRNRIDAIRIAIPWRPAATDAFGMLRYPKPSTHGQQTAIVVGAGGPIHTDRDHRIKIQFHWQRGTSSHSRLSHPYPDGHSGAPATDTAGTWVRVATTLAPIAGANWGAHALPRVGQEVIVDFLEGDIDRPVVIGTLYNGRGQHNSQANAVAHGTGVATGNAPAWFAGSEQGHAHAMVFSGIRSQALASSQNGGGGVNQLLFDDTPGQSRIALQQHASPNDGSAELNLGHLRHQADNERLETIGYGVELTTQHGAAIRAGEGLLISADARLNVTSTQLDSKEAQAQLQASHQLQTSLAQAAQQHGAVIAGEANAAELPAIGQLAHSIDVISATATGQDGTTVTAYSEPQLQLSSPAGIAATTPASIVMAAGSTMSITAGQDINITAQGGMHHLVKNGIRLFTVGKATNANKPNQETGIRLHAATGPVSMQSQSDATTITADKTVTVASTTAAVNIASPKHVLLTSGGAYIRLEGGNIEIAGPGMMAFKASLTEFAGPKSSVAEGLSLPKCEPIVSAELPIFSQQFDLSHLAYNNELGFSSEKLPYRVFNKNGEFTASGHTNQDGLTDRILTNEPAEITLLIGDGAWQVEEYLEEDEPHDDDGVFMPENFDE